MVKKFTLFFLLGIFGLFTTNVFAQEDATIDPSNIRFWIGEGENEVVFIVNWNEPDTALAWGYRFEEETITVKDMMMEIQVADSRFGYDGDTYVNDITFNDGILDLGITEGGYFMYNVNGVMAMEGFSTQTIVDGDYVKWGDTNCGTMIDPATWAYVWEKEIAAVYPLADEATIDASEIVYWIGEGENYVVFCVNWNEPNVALAWGVRFSEEEITVKEIMDIIVAEDLRLKYIVGDWGISDIVNNDYVNHYSLVGSFWWYNINGLGAWYGYDQQTVVNGDFIKWGDVSCATEIAEYSYVWEQTVQPVSIYDNVDEFEVESLSIYPNPAMGETYVTIANAGHNVIAMYDMQGRMVSEFSVDATEGENVRINTEMMAGGMYFVTVSNGSTLSRAKLIVK